MQFPPSINRVALRPFFTWTALSILQPKEENNIITTVIPYSHPQAIPEVIKNTNCMSLKFASIEDKDNYTSKLIA